MAGRLLDLEMTFAFLFLMKSRKRSMQWRKYYDIDYDKRNVLA